jgi:deazaflavin-dependent oxidoreductase (nitroreductase family)
MMQTNAAIRLVNGFLKLHLVLSALLAAQFLLVMSLIRLMRHDTRLRTKVFQLANPLTLSLAGRRFSPFALLRHRGRRSSRAYVTPVRAYPLGDGFVLGLTWGSEVDWCRNVMASGKGMLRWYGQDDVLERPELIPATSARAAYPLPIKLAMLLGVAEQGLWLHRPSEDSDRDKGTTAERREWCSDHPLGRWS